MAARRRPANKFAAVLREFRAGRLHHGSKAGPLVTDPKVALAIAFSEARRRRRRRRTP